MNASRFLLPVLIVAALYFLFLRPQKNRQKAAAALASNITPGQRVVTTAGMYATVVELDDAGVLLEIAPGVQVRYVRQAISRVVEDEYVPEVGGVEGEYAEDGVAYDDEDRDDELEDEALEGDEPTEEELDSDEFDDTGRNHGESELVELTKDARGGSQQPGATRFDQTGSTDAADQARR